MADRGPAEPAGGVALPPWVHGPWPQQGPPRSDPGAAAEAAAPLQEELEALIAASGLPVRLSLHDLLTGGWIEVQAHRRLYPASLIKTLLLLAALERAEGGSLPLGEVHLLQEGDRYAGGTPVAGTGILQFAAAGSSYTLGELLRLMISLSDNVAANIIFERIGAAGCAATAARLGLRDSAFTRKFYDLRSALPSNVATAHELTRMLLALQNREVAGERLTRCGIEMMAATADKGRIGRLGGDRLIVANKVGTVSGIIGDMALLYFPHRPPLALTVIVECPPHRQGAIRLIGMLARRIARGLAGEERC